MTDTDRSETGRGQQRQQQQGYSDSLHQRAVDTYDSARDGAAAAGRRASDAIGDSPLVALGAGIAAGALIAALLPTSRRERALLAPYGSKVTGAARDAAGAARQAGSQKLQELGLTPDTLLDKAGETVRTTAQAAVGTFREDAAQAVQGVARLAGGSGKKSGRSSGGKSGRGSQS